MNTGPRGHWRTILHTYPCGTCGAIPGASCRSPSGRVQHMPHVDRYEQAHGNDWRDWEDRAPDDTQPIPTVRNDWEQ